MSIAFLFGPEDASYISYLLPFYSGLKALLNFMSIAFLFGLEDASYILCLLPFYSGLKALLQGGNWHLNNVGY
jgi:hypothetical protein